jgi:hypothetical protein
VGWWILGGVAALIVVLWVANRVGWIDLSDKSRRGGSGGGGLMQIGDEIFAPARHEAQVELDRQSRMPAPAPIPGDGHKGIYLGGTVSITLDAHGRPVYDREAPEGDLSDADNSDADHDPIRVSAEPDAPRFRA